MMKKEELMDFNTFKKAVISDIWSYMPQEMQHLKMTEHSVKNVNATVTGLRFEKKGLTGLLAYPTICVENLYEDYLEDGDLKKCLQKGARIVRNGLENGMDIIELLKKDKVEKNIVFQLINTERNEELLADIPHRNFQDLSIIYRYIIDCQEEYFSSIIIDNNLLELLEMNEQLLYNLALVNTKELFPIKILECVISEASPEYNMFIITNRRNNASGSTSILYDEVIHFLEERIKDSFYIMPSSINEMIVVSSNDSDLTYLKETVKEANDSLVKTRELLSYNVYFYDKNMKEIRIVS